MRRRRLTAQDAFVGVREPEPPPPPTSPRPQESLPEVGEGGPLEEAAPPLTAEEQVELEGEEQSPAHQLDQSSPPAPPAAPETAERKRKQQKGDLMAALQEMQAAIAAQRARERLTLYLPADLSSQLNEFWATIRGVTQVKIGKSALAEAALRVVLRNTDLRADCAFLALEGKIARKR
ncbi:MAG: hypothetical protein ACUVX8_00940 [Candidatus Zipacnadales bacterium]